MQSWLYASLFLDVACCKVLLNAVPKNRVQNTGGNVFITKPKPSVVGATVNILGQPAAASCLHGSDTVQVINGSSIEIQNLQRDDSVLSYDTTTDKATFSPVMLQVHPYNRAQSKGYRIETSLGRSLSVTPEHLLLVDTPSGLVSKPASDVAIGDILPVAADTNSRKTFPTQACRFPNNRKDPVAFNDLASLPLVHCDRVTNVTRAVLTGLYSPITHSGTLFVNGVLVSAYSYFTSHSKAHEYFGMLRSLPGTVISQLERLMHEHFEVGA